MNYITLHPTMSAVRAATSTTASTLFYLTNLVTECLPRIFFHFLSKYVSEMSAKTTDSWAFAEHVQILILWVVTVCQLGQCSWGNRGLLLAAFSQLSWQTLALLYLWSHVHISLNVVHACCLLCATGGVVSFELDGQDPCYAGKFYMSAINGTRLFLIVLENLRDLSQNPFNINCHVTRT